jgi:hypothetical protein
VLDTLLNSQNLLFVLLGAPLHEKASRAGQSEALPGSGIPISLEELVLFFII